MQDLVKRKNDPYNWGGISHGKCENLPTMGKVLLTMRWNENYTLYHTLSILYYILFTLFHHYCLSLSLSSMSSFTHHHLQGCNIKFTIAPPSQPYPLYCIHKSIIQQFSLWWRTSINLTTKHQKSIKLFPLKKTLTYLNIKTLCSRLMVKLLRRRDWWISLMKSWM